MSVTNKEQYQLVKVYIRQRPFTKDEIELRHPNIVQKVTSSEIVIKSGQAMKKYNFDKVFGEEASQEEIYDTVVFPLIDYIISGYNCTVFAYGQTGTGKTFTMIGDSVGFNIDLNRDLSVGLMPRAAVHLFSQLEKLGKHIEYTVRVSFVEIYNEEVRDLLVKNSPPLRIYDDPENKGSVSIRGLREITVHNKNEVFEWLKVGIKERQTAATNLNRHSSRSHTIFTLLINTKETTSDGEEIIKSGKLHLIDLAGSENIGRSGATDARAREAGTINKSLLTLGKVIKALAQKMQHIPYRDSKLTRILQDSLGGNTKTCMIATFTPSISAWDETLSTLDYAHVARSVANCPQVNINRKQATIVKALTTKISKLRQELSAARSGDGFYISSETYEKMSEDIDKKNEKIGQLLVEIKNLEEYRKLKENEYFELAKSFDKTRAYLEKSRQELETKKDINKKNVRKIAYLNERGKELTTAAKELLNICKSTAEHQHIYHTKYQNLCSLTLDNAQIAKDLSTSSSNCLKGIEIKSESFIANQKSHIKEIDEEVTHLNNCQSETAEELGKTVNKVQTEVDSCKLTVYKILENTTCKYVENYIHQHFDSHFKSQDLNLLEGQEKMNALIAILKNYISEISAKAELEASNNLNLIDGEYNDEINCSSKTKHTFNNYLDNLQKKRSNLDELYKKKIEEKKNLQLETENLKRQEEELLMENILLAELYEELDLLSKEYNKKNPLQALKASLETEKEDELVMNKTKTEMMEELLNCMVVNRGNNETLILENKNETCHYVKGLIKNCRSNLNIFNTKLEEIFLNIAEIVERMKNNLNTTILDHSVKVAENVECLVESNTVYNDDIKNFVSHFFENIGSREKNIITQAHAGDTPQKPIYNFPSNIEQRISEVHTPIKTMYTSIEGGSSE